MTDCDDIIHDFHQLTHDQLDLAIIAEAPAVAAMHIDLAAFGEEQAALAEDLCDDADT